ncbi:MAG: molybdenum cofactor guanylyltransferase [Candidatus Methanomethylicaceae archaeon]
MVEEIATVILAGGRSSRFGEFKPTARLSTRPLISYAIEIARVSSPHPYILVSSKEQAETIRETIGSNDVIIMTEPEGVDQRLRIPASLSALSEVFIFLMGCDTPFLDPRLPLILRDRIGTSPAIIPIWPNGYLEPLAALYRRISLSGVGPISSFREIALKIGAKTVDMDALRVRPESFFNINTPSDLKRAEMILRTLFC